MAKKGRDWEKEVTNEVLQRIMRLVKDREAGKLSVFSRKTEIDKATYYTWLDRNSTPSVDMLVRIRNAYGVTLDWLVCGGESTGASGVAESRLQCKCDAFWSQIQSQQETIVSQARAIERLSAAPAPAKKARRSGSVPDNGVPMGPVIFDPQTGEELEREVPTPVDDIAVIYLPDNGTSGAMKRTGRFVPDSVWKK